MSATATLPAMPRKPLAESEKKITIGSRVDPATFEAIERLAREDDRTISYVIEKLLKDALARLSQSKPRHK